MTTNPFAAGSPFEGAPLARTRLGLHQLAEHVLAAELHRHTGRIGLRPTPGGIGTPTFDVDGTERRVRVQGGDLVVEAGGEQVVSPVTTVAAAGDLLGLTPGAPDVYTAVTPLQPDRPLDLDVGVVAALADWLAVADEALRAFGAAHGGPDPVTPQLWPEHFDLAISLDEVNYGASPGDDDHLLPYAYVGPWAVPQDAGRDGSWWNQPYGRGVSAEDLGDAATLVALFEQGRSRTS